ncbi:RNA polymerase subunit sigma-70 [Echinicola strongylocentroti]|uniref:RNA polymerase subunit sigma-70 n=1 Tax=Echinicola strongylocentroti TaxID=1795355 RepID=A0A2Z4IP27_9BACT|nr:sigma-70 family RNA polymerase sigma factor [Echinicola strongylocentroti]AWW32378.1 RNA polymerase subunit sigma-70 [Echinicola strongylocentroti]
MESYRPLLFTYAYNILGAAMDAEDVVQDVYERYLTIDKNLIKNEKAYLIRMVINHAINQKKKLKGAIASYPNDWLPEPVLTETPSHDHILSYSMILLLEKLEVRQRAIFLLKEAFGYSHKEICQTLNITPEVSRQSLSRAKKKLKGHFPSHASTLDHNNLKEYLSAIQNADAEALEKLLLEDISLTSDGGGKVPAGTKPIFGKSNVMAMLQGLYKKFYQHITIQLVTINHTPALLYLSPEGRVINCQVMVFDGNRVAQIFFIRNPDKLIFLQKKRPKLSHNQ